MIDLKIFKQYLITLDNFDIRHIEVDLFKDSFCIYLDKILKNLDCSKIYKDGSRAMQTIGYPYRFEISRFFYVYNNYLENELKDDYASKLLTLHNANLEFEAINPPIWYGGDKAKAKFEKDYKIKSKTKSKTKTSKEKGPSKAELKLAAKAAKINKLTFNIKPV